MLGLFKSKAKKDDALDKVKRDCDAHEARIAEHVAKMEQWESCWAERDRLWASYLECCLGMPSKAERERRQDDLDSREHSRHMWSALWPMARFF